MQTCGKPWELPTEFACDEAGDPGQTGGGRRVNWSRGSGLPLPAACAPPDDERAGHGRGRRAGDCGRRPGAGRAADRARHRHGAGLQHGGHQDPRRRRHRQGVVRRRPGREGGRSALPDRSAAVPGGARAGAGGQGTQRGAARERRARPLSRPHAQQGRLPVAPELRRADGGRAGAQGPDRLRPGGDHQRQAQSRLTPTSARPSTAAPAPAWSISATSCRRPRRPAWSRSRR